MYLYICIEYCAIYNLGGKIQFKIGIKWDVHPFGTSPFIFLLLDFQFFWISMAEAYPGEGKK
jgi:hypothetical protein